ncbi:MAG: hypothetical protein AB7Q00_14700 [Phycisphaerales bacterium]
MPYIVTKQRKGDTQRWVLTKRGLWCLSYPAVNDYLWATFVTFDLAREKRDALQDDEHIFRVEAY